MSTLIAGDNPLEECAFEHRRPDRNSSMLVLSESCGTFSPLKPSLALSTTNSNSFKDVFLYKESNLRTRLGQSTQAFQLRSTVQDYTGSPSNIILGAKICHLEKMWDRNGYMSLGTMQIIRYGLCFSLLLISLIFTLEISRPWAEDLVW